MAANCELQKVHEWQGMRGFSNLFKKEHRSWWGTRRWWVNTLLWAVLIVGLSLSTVREPFVGANGLRRARDALYFFWFCIGLSNTLHRGSTRCRLLFNFSGYCRNLLNHDHIPFAAYRTATSSSFVGW